MKYFILIAFCLTAYSVLAQKQGIRGQVVWVSGNQMPGPDRKITESPGIKREIYIYQATTLDQATVQDGVFFSNITTALVKEIRSNKKGKFCVKLPPGEYSVFVKESRGLFANSFDMNNRIQCITVKSGEYANPVIQVNYEAAY